MIVKKYKINKIDFLKKNFILDNGLNDGHFKLLFSFMLFKHSLAK